jgi:hypothetical protein
MLTPGARVRGDPALVEPFAAMIEGMQPAN